MLYFLSAIDNYGKLDSEIMNASKNEIKDMMVLLRGSFIRSLSSELYRHGYACSATLLRRVLVEDSISRSQSKYYTYAASDMKKVLIIVKISYGLKKSLQQKNISNRYLSSIKENMHSGK